MSEPLINARIDSTMLGIEDHGIFTFSLGLSHDGGHQGFGGFCLDNPDGGRSRASRRVGTAFGATAIMRVLEVVGVGKWEDLKGKHVRFQRNSRGTIQRIGHIIEDKWLDLVQLAEEEKKAGRL